MSAGEQEAAFDWKIRLPLAEKKKKKMWAEMQTPRLHSEQTG